MKKEEYEQFEYARKRVKQKKRFYYHSILFLIGSATMYITNNYLNVAPETNWYQWGIAFWLFILILHFVKVYITNQFMGKDWERDEINKLIKKQEDKRKQLENKAENNNSELP